MASQGHNVLTHSIRQHHSDCSTTCVSRVGVGVGWWWELRNAYELVKLGAIKSSVLNKLHIFQCRGDIFFVEFLKYRLKFHTKYLTHTLQDAILYPKLKNLRTLRLTSSYGFLKRPHRPFNNKGDIKLSIANPLWGKSDSDPWIPHTQRTPNAIALTAMAPSWWNTIRTDDKGQVTKVQLYCYLVLLLFDSKTR